MAGVREEPVAAPRDRASLHQPAAPRHDPGARAGHLLERRRLRDAAFGVVAAFMGDDGGRNRLLDWFTQPIRSLLWIHRYDSLSGMEIQVPCLCGLAALIGPFE